jgi:CheY-like chemotaxis protein
LFLHLLASELPPTKEMLGIAPSINFARQKSTCSGRRVRNIFALTSLLEQHGMQVVSAETGTEVFHRRPQRRYRCGTHGHHDAEMDYETCANSRQQPAPRLPILALTPKATKATREMREIAHRLYCQACEHG